MCYKFFTTKYGTDVVSKIDELRVAFPKCLYASGIWKGTRGIFAFRSNDIKDYGKHWTQDDGNEFFEPTKERAMKQIKVLGTGWVS